MQGLRLGDLRVAEGLLDGLLGGVLEQHHGRVLHRAADLDEGVRRRRLDERLALLDGRLSA